ncbi:MAG: hypothetical protein KIS77_02370 [Saprospiraceae bacterium]|nr:hypothetical protein [Saprospiraceae bacterium]
MKLLKSAFLSFCLTSPFFTWAQLPKGGIILEGNFYFGTPFKDENAPEGTKSPYQLGLGASAGFLITPRTELGFGLGLLSSRSAYFPTPDPGSFPYPIFFGNVRKAWGITPRIFWRHYSQLAGKILFSSGVAFNTQFGSTEQQDFSSGAVLERNFTQLSLGYTPSLVYQFSPRLGVRGNFGLIGFVFVKEEGVESWDKNFSASFSPQNLNFGIFFLVNAGKSTD